MNTAKCINNPIMKWRARSAILQMDRISFAEVTAVSDQSDSTLEG